MRNELLGLEAWMYVLMQRSMPGEAQGLPAGFSRLINSNDRPPRRHTVVGLDHRHMNAERFPVFQVSEANDALDCRFAWGNRALMVVPVSGEPDATGEVWGSCMRDYRVSIVHSSRANSE